MSWRDQLVASVREWTGTPYHHMGRIKGVGVDCGQLIIESFRDAGLVDARDPGSYTPDWHLHRDLDLYRSFVEEYLVPAGECEDPLDDRKDLFLEPGEVIIFRVGRTFSHGGIITSWPNMIHAYVQSGIVEEVDVRFTPMANRPCRVYTYEGGNK